MLWGSRHFLRHVWIHLHQQLILWQLPWSRCKNTKLIAVMHLLLTILVMNISVPGHCCTIDSLCGQEAIVYHQKLWKKSSMQVWVMVSSLKEMTHLRPFSINWWVRTWHTDGTLFICLTGPTLKLGMLYVRMRWRL